MSFKVLLLLDSWLEVLLVQFEGCAVLFVSLAGGILPWHRIGVRVLMSPEASRVFVTQSRGHGARTHHTMPSLEADGRRLHSVAGAEREREMQRWSDGACALNLSILRRMIRADTAAGHVLGGGSNSS